MTPTPGYSGKPLPALRKALRPDAALWVSWPKRSSGVRTDVTEDTIREAALPLGFVVRTALRP